MQASLSNLRAQESSSSQGREVQNQDMSEVAFRGWALGPILAT